MDQPSIVSHTKVEITVIRISSTSPEKLMSSCQDRRSEPIALIP